LKLPLFLILRLRGLFLFYGFFKRYFCFYGFLGCGRGVLGVVLIDLCQGFG